MLVAEILQAIPETVSPSEYKSILPAKAHDDGAAVGTEKKDAVEDPAILAMLGEVAVQYAAPEPTTQLTPEEMTAWCAGSHVTLFLIGCWQVSSKSSTDRCSCRCGGCGK